MNTTEYTEEEYHTEFRGYEYDLHKAYEHKHEAKNEASMIRQCGTGNEHNGQVCRACVKQLSNGKWAVYIRYVTLY